MVKWGFRPERLTPEWSYLNKVFRKKKKGLLKNQSVTENSQIRVTEIVNKINIEIGLKIVKNI